MTKYDYTYIGFTGSLSAALDTYECKFGRRPDIIRCNPQSAVALGSGLGKDIAGDMRDLLMPQADQILYRGPCPADIIHVDTIHPQVSRIVIDRHAGDPAVNGLLELLEVADDIGKDYSAYAL